MELHEEEKPYLIDLPAIRFDAAQVVYRKVDSEGFINYADNRYSVPWRLIGQLIPVRILEDKLEDPKIDKKILVEGGVATSLDVNGN